MTTPAADGASLAAMISALAQVTAAQAEEGLSWNEIAERYGYPSGRQAKKIVHGLRVRVQRELAAIAARQAQHECPQSLRAHVRATGTHRGRRGRQPGLPGTGAVVDPDGTARLAAMTAPLMTAAAMQMTAMSLAQPACPC